MRTLACIIYIISAASLLASCLSEEGFSAAPSIKLHSSIDTLSLDTVIAGEPTNTYTFQIYNRSTENARITRVFLDKGEHSPFRVNVNGTFLRPNSPNNTWELYGNDSLRVFVELTAPESQQSSPQSIEDKLSFQLENGNVHLVVLKATGQRVTRFATTTLSNDTILNANIPYIIKDSLVVPEGKTLTLTAGTRLYFHPSAELIVYGRLVIQGTAERNVLLRGDRMGYMFSQQPYDRIPNQWGGVVVKPQSYNNTIDFCDIHSADFGIRCDSSDVNTLKLKLTNSILHNFSNDALHLNQCNTEIGNTQITNAGGNCVTIIGGHHTFTHCTIGQFYSFIGSKGIALSMSNVYNQQFTPISQAFFRNCLITGYNEDDIKIVTSARYAQENINFQFHHCVLNTPFTTDKERVINCIFESELPSMERREKHFSPAFDFQRLQYNFTLRPNSTINNKADVELTKRTFPLDRQGHSRIINDTAAPGCYTIVATNKKGE